MRHIKGFKTLNRTHSHRKALYKNMATSLLKHERIKTTTIKAKEIRRVVEKMITRAKDKSLHNIRIIGKLITDKEILMKLFNEIGPRYKERHGGYTRITKLAKRKGDGAEVAYIELIEEQGASKKKKKTVKASIAASDKKEKAVKEEKPAVVAPEAETKATPKNEDVKEEKK